MASMFVLAVRNLSGDEDRRVEALAAALGLPAYDAHLRAQGPAPRVVATYGAKAEASRASEALHAAGLDPFVLGEEQIESDAQRVLPRSFTPRVVGPSGSSSGTGGPSRSTPRR